MSEHLPPGRAYELVAPETGHTVPQPPQEPGVGQVLLRVRANGVCASDLATWASPRPSYPVRIGHEPVGQVVGAGPGVSIPEGTWATGRIVESFADYALADVRDVVVVPDGVEWRHALGEPLGCVAEGVRRTPVHLADRVAVIGLGFMGLCTVQLLARTATASVTAVDLRADARRTALAVGADEAFDPRELPAGSPGRGYDVVVEATGTQPGLDLATELVRPHGTLSILGYHQGTRQVDLAAWNWKALDVVNAHVRDRDLLRESTRRALDMVAAGRIDLGPLITHRYSLDQVDDAFRDLRAKPDGFVKAVIMN